MLNQQKTSGRFSENNLQFIHDFDRGKYNILIPSGGIQKVPTDLIA
jgi:hypothetical protein